MRLLLSGRLFAPVALAIAVAMLAPAARAATIASSGSTGNVAAQYAFGQSVTTPGGGPWNSIVFNFYDSSNNPYATGSLYLLDHEYLGTAANLSSQTKLGVATASGGTWTFAPSLILQSSTQYWFYMDTSSGATNLFFSASNQYSGGNLYVSSQGTSNYISDTTYDAAFLLQGAPGPLPGAGLLSYLVVGFGGAAAFRKKLRVRAASLCAAVRLRWAERPLLKSVGFGRKQSQRAAA